MSSPGRDPENDVITAMDSPHLPATVDAQRLLEESEQRYRPLVEEAPDPILTSSRGVISYANRATACLFGVEQGALIGRHLLQFVHPDDHARADRAAVATERDRTDVGPRRYRVVTATGEVVEVEARSAGICLDGRRATQTVIRDVSLRVMDERTRDALRGPTDAMVKAASSEAVAELCHVTAIAIGHAEALTRAHAAVHDGPDDLDMPGLMREVTALLHACPEDRLIGAICIGVDDIGVVIQSLGHDAAQVLLGLIASRVRSRTSAGDILASVSGERLVLCRTMGERVELEELAASVRAALADPVECDGRELFLHVSIGLADSAGRDDADQLITRSSTAMWHARETGGDTSRWYDDDLRLRAARRLEVEVALRHALDRDELTVRYQPKVRLRDGRIDSAEALVRWTSPTLGEVTPDEFIPIAESTGVVVALGRHVLTIACRDAVTWRSAQPEVAPSVAVNVSTHQLHEPGFPDQVAHALTASGLDPTALCLELTETSVMRDVAASTTVLRQLKALGVRLSIDDFGTGYSSLAYLKDFPIDQLKVDRSFVADIERDPSAQQIVAAIVAVADALGLEVVAEGIETDAQLQRLVELGCTAAQGHLWAGALPVGDLCDVVGTVVPVPARPATAGTHLVDESTDDVLALISHELGSSLTVLTGYGELLANGQIDPRQGGEVVHRVSRRLAASLGSLRDVRALSNGSIELERTQVDLACLVEAVLGELAASQRERIRTTCTGAVVVEGDPARIGMVISNLVQNALRFHRGPEPVEVAVDVSPGTARLTVSDRGPGVPDASTGMIFRKFGRAHAGQGSISGLGLFLARGVARAHGGDVRYAHRPGGGAEFTLHLPAQTS